MIMKSSLSILALSFVSMLSLGSAPAGSPALVAELPDGIAAGYEELSRSMREEDMRAFMDLFSLEFVHVAPDGRSRDRGPWRRLWLDNFRKLDYPLLTSRIENVSSNEAERVVLEVKIVEVTRPRGEDGLRVREYLVEDIWVLEQNGWKLIYREEKSKSEESRIVVAPALSPPNTHGLQIAGSGYSTLLAVLWPLSPLTATTTHIL